MRTTQQKVREKNGENIDSNQMKLDAESEKTDIQMESNENGAKEEADIMNLSLSIIIK